MASESVLKPSLSERLLERMNKASYLFELQEVGWIILKIRIESRHVSLIYAWQTAWERLEKRDLVEKEFRSNEFYLLVLEELRNQESSKRSEMQKSISVFQKSVEAIEALVRRGLA